MVKNLDVLYRFIIAAILWSVIPPAFPQQQEAAGALSASDISPQDLENQDAKQLLEKIKARRKFFEQKAKEASKRFAGSTRSARDQLASSYARLDGVYEQQIAELERLLALEVKKQQYEAETEKLRQAPLPGQVHSFMELDRSRDELNIESRREKMLSSKIELAEQALAQAVSDIQQSEEKVADLEKASANANSNQPNIVLENARIELESARQVEVLRRLALRSERMEQSVHQAFLTLLQKRVDFLHHHARFEANEMQQQLRRIDKEQFELKRVVSRAKEQQAFVKSRLEQTRKKLFSATPTERRAIEMENDTLQLKYEALKNESESAARRDELLEASKLIWQRRYAVFNGVAESSKQAEWRKSAKQQLEQIGPEESNLRFWLGDWQTRLASLEGKIDNAQAPGADNGIARQRQQVVQIIDSIQSLLGALENYRRLQQKLIDEIDVRTSHRSWRDWLEVSMNYKVYDNSMLAWSRALASLLMTFLLLYFIRWILIRRLKYLEEPGRVSLAGGFLNTIKRANSIFFLMLGVFVASRFLTLDLESKKTIYDLTKVAIVFQAAVWGSGLVRSWVFLILARRTKRDGASMGALTIFNFASQVILWSFALLLILQSLGIDVTALVAGLGIGGIAVALSLQRILNDLFSSLSIVLDKPFVVGDFVVFDDFFGAIEHIGIKTTRIRSLSGEQIVCSNGDLLNTRIRNFKRMNERRVVFKIGVVYQTPEETLSKIPAMIREIIEERENARFDRAHFASYGDFALLFETVYYVMSPDYNLYMDVQQAINLEIFKRFRDDNIQFAYPSQSIYLQNVS